MVFFSSHFNVIFTVQSQKIEGFCVSDFATLSDERRLYLKTFVLFIWIKEPCVRKFEGLVCSKVLGISQTKCDIDCRMVCK